MYLTCTGVKINAHWSSWPPETTPTKVCVNHLFNNLIDVAAFIQGWHILLSA